MELKNKIRKAIREEIKKLKTKKDLKETAIELGYLSEYVVGGLGPSRHFKTDEDQEKLVDLVRQFVSDPDDAENIAMRFLGDDKARKPDVDDPGFGKAFYDLVNYEIRGLAQYIGGGLENATIKYKGQTYTNVSFEQEDDRPNDYAGHITMPIYNYTAKAGDVTFDVPVMNDENTEEPQWDDMEASQSNRR